MALGSLSLYLQSFPVFVLAGAVFGINMAFTLQYRYAAAESVGPQFAPRAISFVLVGAIGGAIVGPQLVKYGEFLFPSVQYLGSFAAVSVLYLLQSVLHLTLGSLRGEESDTKEEPQRSLAEITRQPVFVVAVLGGAAAYGVMTFIMTATPLSMHVHDGFSLEATAQVIQGHVLAMYVPSFNIRDSY